MNKRHFFSLFFASFVCLLANSQHEFLTVVNPSNVTFTSFDSISGVHWIYNETSTIDENNHRYFFVGTNVNYSPKRLYSVDSQNGTVVSSPVIPSNIDENTMLIGLEYDNNTDTLYGLVQIPNNSNFCFAWIDPINGNVQIKNCLPVTSLAMGSTTYDENAHRYFLSDGTTEYVINAQTGQVMSSYLPNTPLANKIFSNNSNKFYCLSNANNSTQWEFCSANVLTGQLQTISILPCQYITILPVYKAIDEANGRYFFIGIINNISYLYSVDLNTGNVLSSSEFNYYESTNNLIEFEYDNTLDTLLALHWGDNTANEISLQPNNLLTVYPNPTTSDFTVYMDVNGSKEIEVTDLMGRLIYKDRINENELTIHLGDEKNGVYFVSVKDANTHYGIKRVVKND